METRTVLGRSRFGRGTCPVCGRSIALLRDGTIGPHGDKKTFPPVPCSGWREKPKEGRDGDPA